MNTGWALGEHLEWSKYNNFRVATNVPLMVHVPGLTGSRGHGDSGTVSNALVELVDLFPTLAELAGLKVPGKGLCTNALLITLIENPCQNISRAKFAQIFQNSIFFGKIHLHYFINRAIFS